MDDPRGRVGILSLGCPRNLVDSEGIISRLKGKGYAIVDIDQAEVAVINTCSFIDEAKKESIEAILEVARLKKEGRLKKIIVYGCLPQRFRNRLAKELPEVDAFVGRLALDGAPSRFILTPGHYAYLKICEGCVNACSYCVIPKIKGRFTSLNADSLIRKARQFDASGVKELNIIGQDITGWGLDLCGRRKLPALVKEILKAGKNIGWIRLLYLFPGDIVRELLGIIRDEPRICKYIDLPLQHINDRILRLMHRRTTKSELLRLIETIRKKVPAVAIRTTFITGFPSETEAEFQELLDFIKCQRFERLGAFIYSREEGTAAYRLKGQIPRAVKIARFDQIMQAQQEISRLNNQRLLGREIKVLIDEKEDSTYIARSEYDAPEVDGQVYVRSRQALKVGDFARVRITDTLEYDLLGEALA
jgi:ribosomal protein S12 methylthiotransferase